MSKVLFLTNIALENPKRGTPIHVARLLKELRREHDMVVCAASVPDALRDVFVQYPRGRGVSKLRALLRIVDEHKPQTIFTIGQTGLMAPVMLKFLRGVKIVVELQGVEYIEKYAMGHIGLLHSYFWKCKSILLLPLYDVVISFTKRMVALYPFLREIRIIHATVDFNTLPYVEDHMAIPPLVAGYCGNMDAYQGISHLIEAVAITRQRGIDTRLYLIVSGDDTKLEEVRAELQKHDLTGVTTIVRNMLQHEAQHEMLKTSVLVVPRPNVPVAMYGFPGKLAEGLATGLPVIATNTGAVSELMPEIGEHAIVIPCEDITNHLADALQRVANMSPHLRKQRGDAARKYAQKFSWENVTPIVSDAL